MRKFVGGAMPPPGREWEIGRNVDEIVALHKVIDNTKFWVVCDTNGECKGIFMTQDLAHKVADFYGAYVSGHVAHSEIPQDMLNEMSNNSNEGDVK